MTDLMDDRLRSAAQRWQRRQPPPPPVPEDLSRRATSARPARAWIAAGAAAAAVAAAVVLATALPRGGGSPATDPGTATSPSPSTFVVAWADLPPTHPQGARKYEGLLVAGDLDAQVTPGSTFDYTIYLTALGEPVTLDPCPDYSVWVGAAGGPRRSLNCAAVPYVDAAGRPYLPAGVTVGFDMRLEVPDLPGEQKILWVVDGPHRLPGTHGVLTID